MADERPEICLACDQKYIPKRYANGRFRRFCEPCYHSLSKSERDYLYQKKGRADTGGQYFMRWTPDKPESHPDFCKVPGCRDTHDIDRYCTFHWKQRHLYE